MVLPAPLARAGQMLERRIAPPFYRRTPIVTLSESSRRHIMERLRLPAERLHVVPPGVDVRFTPGPSATTPLVAAVGRLMPAKGFPSLVRALAEVRRAVPEVELVIVGEGYERERIEGTIREFDAESWVTMPGRLSDDAIVDLYRRAWVVASASRAEGWGMTLTEAAACGTPPWPPIFRSSRRRSPQRDRPAGRAGGRYGWCHHPAPDRRAAPPSHGRGGNLAQ